MKNSIKNGLKMKNKKKGYEQRTTRLYISANNSI